MIIKPDKLKKTIFAVYFMTGFSAAPHNPGELVPGKIVLETT